MKVTIIIATATHSTNYEGLIMKSSKISKKKAKVLIQSSEWLFDAILTKKLPPNTFTEAVYKGSNNEVLAMLEDGTGFLYQNEQDWLAFISAIEALISNSSRVSHILEGKLPHSQQFGEVSSELAKTLYLQLNLAAIQLDNSVESLRTVDHAIQKIGQSHCLSPHVFEPLLAYLGEVVKKQEQIVHWEMQASISPDEKEIWEPWLVVHQKRTPIFIGLYDELYESRKASTYRLVISSF
ncbi:MAG: hypothetical protein WBB82_00465 [Limnothrix sp.]